MSEILTIYQGNDTIIEVAGLKNEVSGAFINNATVNVTLVDADSEEVVGQAWPLVLVYVTDSDGLYRATLAFDLELTLNVKYIANIFVSSGGLVANWSTDVICKKRK